MAAKQWVDEWPDLEPVEVQKPHTMDMILVIAIVGGCAVLSAVVGYVGMAWLLGVL